VTARVTAAARQDRGRVYHPGSATAAALIHALNEHMRLEDARRAIKAFAALKLL
jgi:acetylornithine deacetylase/succinyl-diaminopimelate desuccinylase-like protein